MAVKRSKGLFWVSVGVLALSLTVLFSLGAGSLARFVFDSRSHSSPGGAVLVPVLIISLGLVTLLYRRLGWSAEARRAETLSRSSDAVPVYPVVPVEVRLLRSWWSASALLLDVSALMLWGAVTMLPSVPGTEKFAYGGAVFLTLFSLGFWYGWATRSGLIVSLSADGIRAENVGPKTFLHWGEVASCEVEENDNVFGERWQTRLTFLDADDTILMRLSLILVPAGDTERLLTALRGALPSVGQ